jgi:hypothetical protein
VVDLQFPQMQKPNKNLKNPQKDLLCIHPYIHIMEIISSIIAKRSKGSNWQFYNTITHINYWIQFGSKNVVLKLFGKCFGNMNLTIEIVS